MNDIQRGRRPRAGASDLVAGDWLVLRRGKRNLAGNIGHATRFSNRNVTEPGCRMKLGGID